MNDGSRQVGCALLAVSGENRRAAGERDEKSEERVRNRAISDRPGGCRGNRVTERSGLEASQHLTEEAMQGAQLALH